MSKVREANILKTSRWLRLPVGRSVDLPFLHHVTAVSTPHVPGKHMTDEHKETWHFLARPGKRLSGTQQITLSSRNVVWALYMWYTFGFSCLMQHLLYSDQSWALSTARVEEHRVCSPVSTVPQSSGALSGYISSRPHPSLHMSLQTGPWCCLGFP